LQPKFSNFYLTNYRFKTAKYGQVLGQKITFSGSLWQLDFLSAYGSFMALFWQLLAASFYPVSGSFAALIICAKYEDYRVTSMI